MNFRLILALFFILHFNSFFGQSQTEMFGGFEKKQKIALDNLIKYKKKDTLRITALQDLSIAGVFFLNQKKKVLPYNKEALQLSQKLNFKKG